MVRKVIAVDFDDVIAAFNQAYVKFHNRQYGSPVLSYADICTFDMAKLYGVSDQVIVERVRKFCHEYHHEILPCEGLKYCMVQLAQQYSLHIVTSRCVSLTETTEEWLVTHGLRKYFAQLHFTNGFGSLYQSLKRSKLEVCREINAVALIEDAPSNAQSVADGGIIVLMPIRPWNRTFEHPQVRRFGDMSEVTSVLIG